MSVPTAGVWDRRAWAAGIVFGLALLAEAVISAGIPINQDDSAAKSHARCRTMQRDHQHAADEHQGVQEARALRDEFGSERFPLLSAPTRRAARTGARRADPGKRERGEVPVRTAPPTASF